MSHVCLDASKWDIVLLESMEECEVMRRPRKEAIAKVHGDRVTDLMPKKEGDTNARYQSDHLQSRLGPQQKVTKRGRGLEVLKAIIAIQQERADRVSSY